MNGIQKKFNIIIFFYLFSSSIALLTMNGNQPLPKLLVLDDKFPVYTRDFINEEIKALVTSEKFAVSIFSETVVTNPDELAKLPDWMKCISMQHLTTMPDDLNEYAIIFACWGNIGEKIAQRKHEGDYQGILITRFRGSPEERIGRPDDRCYPYLKQYGDLYMPNCDFFRKELCDKFGFDVKKFLVHYESVNVQEIQKMIEGLKPKDLIKKTISILSVCRLEPKKGLRQALQAIANLYKKNTSLHVRYTIIGEGSQRVILEEQIKKLELNDIVVMVGGKSKKEVVEMLVQSDILLAPSYTSEDGDVEGIMNVLKEAGLAGTIVVATDHAGAPELIEHDKNGVLAKQNDVDDLTEKLAYAITNPNRWSEWRNNLTKEIRERFNNRQTNQQLIEILTNILPTHTTTKK